MARAGKPAGGGVRTVTVASSLTADPTGAAASPPAASPPADSPSGAGPAGPAGPETATHCPYCALQCATLLSGDRPGVRLRPDPAFPVSRGHLCQKGWTATAVLDAPDRLTAPLLRDAAGELAPTDWGRALDHVAGRLRSIRAAHGPDAVAVLGGGGLTNEKAYLLGKFARLALGTGRIDYNGRFCMAAAAVAAQAAFGVDRGLPFPVTDLDEADVVLLAGANPADTMPPLMRHLERADLIVIDPRPTRTAATAALHLRPVPGTDLAVALGMFHLAVSEGLLDTAYVAERTHGFDGTWARACAWWPERVEAVTGVPAGELRTAVRMLAAAPKSYVLTGRGAEQHSKGTDTVAAFANLALALGLPGRPGRGFGTLTGQGNGQGGREMGQKAGQLPGCRSLSDPADRAHVAGVWGVDPGRLPAPPSGTAPGAYEILDAIGTPGGPRALLVFGCNPAASAPDSARIADRLAQLELLVVADFVPSDTAMAADVVLPVAQWAEEEGTVTNLEGRVLRRRRLLDPPAGVRPDTAVIAELAVRLGEPAAHYAAEPREVFEELREATRGAPADYSGIDYARLDAGETLYWPCPEGSSGTPRMFLDRFAHADGRARFTPVEHQEAAERPCGRYPLFATTGRVLAHYQTGSQTRRVAELVDAVPEPFVQVHPDTAAASGLADGQIARIVSARGSAVAAVRYDAGMRTDTVFVPFHFRGAGRANLFTHAALDPRSGMPEFKVCAVRLEVTS
ncbi:molybdopterin oxidoreductase family protein [Streptomyces sp. NPDC098789]|uniref:molybdopterin oxidoreductase family protein n=1 Tax=Streptomyces sp. NPDC098789 TaxID=3366098 RepID=UPI0037FB1115